MNTNFEITKEMIRKGLDQGLIKIVKEKEYNEIVCQIGEDWFYFCGMELEDLSLDEFFKVTNKEDNINDIYEILKSFHCNDDEFKDEYMYYYHFLVENLH